KTISRFHAHTQLRQSSGASGVAGRPAAGGFDRLARQHGFRVGRCGSLMTFSPELESKFAKLLESYPPGRTRSAVIPMLLFAQDELGYISNELIEEVARRCKVTPLQVDEV